MDDKPQQLRLPESLQRVAAPIFAFLNASGEEGRIVGGVPRGLLMGETVHDIDFATTAAPETVIDRARAAGLEAIPTGIAHGTVTVVSERAAVEVTTLRVDVATDGRHAQVQFGRDWAADARRRDFTINAIYLDENGAVFDPVGGVADCAARRVRFIGAPERRIVEDYLRILRFFRFYARYGVGPPEPATLQAIRATRDGVTRLSAERIGAEFARLLAAPRAPDAIALMEVCGVADIVLRGQACAHVFAALRTLDDCAPEIYDFPLALAALSAGDPHAAPRLQRALRLSKAHAVRIATASRAAAAVKTAIAQRQEARPPDPSLRALLYTYGRQGAVDGWLLAWAMAWARDGQHADAALWRGGLDRLRRTSLPVLPISGRDLVARGIAPGPDVGHWLKTAERLWSAADFAPGRDELLAWIDDARVTPRS